MRDGHTAGRGWFCKRVLLAVPWGQVKDALSAAGAMTGKTLISCVNPFGPKRLEVTLDTCVSEEISRLVPAQQSLQHLIRYLRTFFIPEHICSAATCRQ